MTPTSASLRLTADAKDAFEAGNKIQVHSLEYPHHPWKDCDHPVWGLFSSEYRPTSAHKFRPWTAEEVPLGAILQFKLSGNRFLIIGSSKHTNVFVYFGNGFDRAENILELCTLANGQPCGTEEA